MTDTFTVGQLAEAINANDADRARQILDAQPDLVRTDMAYENEHPTSAGGAGNVEKAKRLIADEAAGMLPPGFIGPNETPGELLLWSGGAGGHTEIVRLALPLFNLPRDDPRWWWMLWHPLFRSLECFKLVLQRCNPDASLYFGRTILHDIAGMYGRDRNREGRDGSGDAIAFATAVLDAGGRLDIRDDLLKSTPLGWACRWGLADLVKLSSTAAPTQWKSSPNPGPRRAPGQKRETTPPCSRYWLRKGGRLARIVRNT